MIKQNSMNEERYARQSTLIGEEGQLRLADSHVAVIGAGGLGSPLLYYLAAAGVGELTIVDDDLVSISNLNRQILFSENEIGTPKASCGAERLRGFNSSIKINPVSERFSALMDVSFLDNCDLVALAVDNRETRLLVNQLCCEKGIPLVDAGVEGLGGYVTAVIPGETPCLECWFGSELPTPRTPQMLGAAVGILSSMEAIAAVQLLLGECKLAGRLLTFDGVDWSTDSISSKKRENCPACSKL